MQEANKECEALPPLPPLSVIWDCDKIKRSQMEESSGKLVNVWSCGWCPPKARGVPAEPFRQWNATKALAHVTKKPGLGIRGCKGKILPNYQARYDQLSQMQENKKEQRESNLQALRDDIDQSQVTYMPPPLFLYLYLISHMPLTFIHPPPCIHTPGADSCQPIYQNQRCQHI